MATGTNTTVTSSSHLRALSKLALLVARVAQRHLYVHLLLSAIDSQRHDIARAVRVHRRREVLCVGYLLAVHADDQVAAQHDRNVPHVGLLVASVQTGAGRGAPWEHAHNQNPIVGGETDLPGDVRADGQGYDVQ